MVNRSYCISWCSVSLANVNLQGHSLFHSWLLPPRLCPGATPSPAPSTPSPFKSIISLALSRPSLSRRYVPLPILQSARPSAGYRLAILQSAGSFLDLLSLALLHQVNGTPDPPTQRDTPGRACSVPFPIRLRANFPPCTDRLSRSDPAFSRRAALFPFEDAYF